MPARVSTAASVVTDGGRVLCVVGAGDQRARRARRRLRRRRAKITWDGAFYRTDIGHRAIQREESRCRLAPRPPALTLRLAGALRHGERIASSGVPGGCTGSPGAEQARRYRFIDSKKSVFVFVSCSFESRNSTAASSSIGCSTLRSTHIFCSSSGASAALPYACPSG